MSTMLAMRAASASQLAALVKRLREDLICESQQKFAERLGVPTASVGGWERGIKGYAPGPESLLKLATAAVKAGFRKEALIFWKLAGVDIHAMTSGVAELLKDRATVIEGVDMVKVPRVREDEHGIFVDVGELVAVPRIASEMASTFVLTDTTLGGGIILNTAKTDMHSLWGEVVLAHFSVDDPNLPEGHFFGVLMKAFHVDARGAWWGAYLESPLRWLHLYPVYVATWEVGKLREGIAEKMKQRIAKETEAMLPQNLKLNPGCRILGRVYGWFFAPVDDPLTSRK